MVSSRTAAARVDLGRYVLFDEIASGGMATVHFARLSGAEGFSRVVAIKRLHPQYAKDEASRSMFVDEARIASRIRHPNVVAPLDVVATENEVFLVMEYVHAAPLSNLADAARKQGKRVPLSITVAVMCQALRGLHAAHTAVDTAGQGLGIIHRDVSPHNILVGADGAARLIDFGIAKAAARSQSTQDGQVKGKLAYMAPEQLLGGDIKPAADIYAMGIVLWELVAGERMFESEEPASLYFKVMNGHVRSPRGVYSDIRPDLEALVMRALSKEPSQRFATAREMADTLESLLAPATSAMIATWVDELAGSSLAKFADIFRRVENEVLSPGVDSAGGRTPLGGSGPAAAALPLLRGPLDGTLASVGSGARLGAPIATSPPSPLPAPLPAAPRAGVGLGSAALVLGTLLLASVGYLWGWPAFLLSRATSEAAALGYSLRAASASGTPSALRLNDVDVSLAANSAIRLHAARLDLRRTGDHVSQIAVEGAALTLAGNWSELNVADLGADVSYQGRVEWDAAFGQDTHLTVGAAQVIRKGGAVTEARLSALRLTTPVVSLGPWTLQREATEQGQTNSLWLDASNLRPSVTCAMQASSERCDVQINRASFAKLGFAAVGLGPQALLLPGDASLALSGRWVSHEKGAEGRLDGTLEASAGLSAMVGLRGPVALHAVIASPTVDFNAQWAGADISGPITLGAKEWAANLRMSTLRVPPVAGKKLQHVGLVANIPLLDLTKSVFLIRP